MAKKKEKIVSCIERLVDIGCAENVPENNRVKLGKMR
jgi:hypothetical protein